MCCTPEEATAYKKDMLSVVKTHIAPSFAVHPRTGDEYPAYNKPEAVIDWLDHVTPDEHWAVVLDSDMILRRPFLPSDFNLTQGWAVGAKYDYMIGVDNELADRHIPEIARRNDTLAGPAGRRSDRVGGFFFIHRDDLKRMSKLWLKYAEDVRADPEVRPLAAAQRCTVETIVVPTATCSSVSWSVAKRLTSTGRAVGDAAQQQQQALDQQKQQK